MFLFVPFKSTLACGTITGPLSLFACPAVRNRTGERPLRCRTPGGPTQGNRTRPHARTAAQPTSNDPSRERGPQSLPGVAFRPGGRAARPEGAATQGPVTQWLECRVVSAEAVGSSPIGVATDCSARTGESGTGAATLAPKRWKAVGLVELRESAHTHQYAPRPSSAIGRAVAF